jgi:hypothetical protein
MKRIFILLTGLLLWSGAWAAPLDRQQREASIRFVNSLQNADGGFRPTASPGSSQLGATTPSLRALRYLDGQPRDRTAAARFVQSCYDRERGGFADTPGGAPDVRSTAMGLMCLTELGQPPGEQGTAVVRYFSQNAHTIAEIYIAEAALEPAKLRPPEAREWLAAFTATRNPDGSYGKTIADTARAIVTRLRLGETVREPEVARTLRSAQRPDGGFAATGQQSDLATTYPVMRALFMMKAKPDLELLHGFVGRCRNGDGGYGSAPGQPSTASATYMAAIVLHWAEELKRHAVGLQGQRFKDSGPTRPSQCDPAPAPARG